MQHGPFFFSKDKQVERSFRQSSLPKQDCSPKRDNNLKSNRKKSMRERLGYSEVHTLPLNTTLTEVLVTIQGKEFVCYPSPIKSHPNTCTSKKYCLFHKDRGHDIEDCYI
jgi:hypothetical protein